MGVRGLQTYLEKYCVEACIPTNLRQLVQDFKEKQETHDAEIVMNIQSLSTFLYADLDWLSGAQMKELARNTIRFVEAFEEIGVKLVIFESGATTNRKFPLWVQRRLKGIDDVNKILDAVSDQRIPVNSFNERPVFIPGAVTMVTKYVFKNVCNCKVLTSHGECDEDIATYARSEKCFAVLGCDTDFVIYNAAKYYLPLYHLNLEAMTAVRYDTEALASHLKLGVSDLPLLASLIGNDLISGDDLEQFQLHLMNTARPRFAEHRAEVTLSRKARIIRAIAHFIKQFPHGRAAYPHLHKVTNLPKFPASVTVAKLVESIESYLPDGNANPGAAVIAEEPATFWNDVLSKAETLSKEAKCDTIYTILRGLPVSMGVTLEDHRRVDLPLTAKLLLALRRKVYGTLLANRPSGPGTVEEWCVCGPDSLKEAQYVSPILPPEGKINLIRV